MMWKPKTDIYKLLEPALTSERLETVCDDVIRHSYKYSYFHAWDTETNDYFAWTQTHENSHNVSYFEDPQDGENEVPCMPIVIGTFDIESFYKDGEWFEDKPNVKWKNFSKAVQDAKYFLEQHMEENRYVRKAEVDLLDGGIAGWESRIVLRSVIRLELDYIQCCDINFFLTRADRAELIREIIHNKTNADPGCLHEPSNRKEK